MHPSPYSDVPTSRLLLLTGQSRERLAAWLGVSARTLAGYAAGRPPPRAVRLALEILAGFMPWPGFEHCTVARGAVYVRDLADGVTPGDMAAVHWQRGRADALARELERYRATPAQFLFDFDPQR